MCRLKFPWELWTPVQYAAVCDLDGGGDVLTEQAPTLLLQRAHHACVFGVEASAG